MAKVSHVPVGVNIQVLGKWNPPVLAPRWFADVGLVPKGEAEAAEHQLVHDEVAQFSLEWVNVHVTRDRLVVGTPRLTHAEALRDLVVGTLDLLTHTPTAMVGINHDYRMTCKDREQFDALGWRLVPPGNWPILDRPGMASLQVQGERTDGLPGYRRIKVEPMLNGTFDVSVGVNDHIQFDDEARSTYTPQIAEAVQSAWYDCERGASAVIDHLAELG